MMPVAKHLGALVAGLCFYLAVAARQNLQATNAIKVTGDIRQPVDIDLKNIAALPAKDLGNIKILNHLGEFKSEEKGVKGVLPKDVLARVEYDVKSPKYLSEYYFTVKGSDGYTVVFSWNELYNSPVGDQAWLVVERDGLTMEAMSDRILMLCTADFNTGRRHVKTVAGIIVRKSSEV